MTDNPSLAASWLAGLAARGITFTERNGRLRCHPARAYSTLTDAEILYLRHNRNEIREALRAGLPVQVETPTSAEGVEPTLEPAPQPERCRWCNHTPCIGVADEHFETLHPEHPETVARQRARATTEMLMALSLALLPERWP